MVGANNATVKTKKSVHKAKVKKAKNVNGNIVRRKVAHQARKNTVDIKVVHNNTGNQMALTKSVEEAIIDELGEDSTPEFK
jgi:hypothetical protein